MPKLTERTPHRREQLSERAAEMARETTGGMELWFLWPPGSGEESTQFFSSHEPLIAYVSTSSAGHSMEDFESSHEEMEAWRDFPSKAPSRRATPLGRRLEELREQIKASGQPLLSWEEIDQELGERRNTDGGY